MSAPTTLTISYGSSKTATVPIPTTGANAPVDYTLAVRNIFLAGGFWFFDGTQSTPVETFVPWDEISLITAA
jgi:hypothetical protein